jgi:hypothetical protein
MIGIKDMEMPKCCLWDCPLAREDGGACQLADVHTSEEERSKDCPLVEIEERKVGIDIDKPQLERALTDAKSFYDDGYKDAKKEVFEEVTRVIKNEYCTYDGDCDSCKKENPYCCRLEVSIDEILELIDGIKGE